MTDADAPPEPASADPSSPELPLPSLKALAKATGVAFAAAAVLLVFVVLPAEYNVDPTGFGGLTGLTRLSAPATEEVDTETANAAREDEVVVEVLPGKSVEYKFWIRTGDTMKWSWQADVSSLRFDFHGEGKDDKEDVYQSYTKSRAKKARGNFTAPFDGIHGWWWKNEGETVARVTLVTSGSYQVAGLR